MIYLSTNRAIMAAIAVVILVISSYFLGSFMSNNTQMPVFTINENEMGFFKNMINDDDQNFTEILEKELNVDNMKKHLE